MKWYLTTIFIIIVCLSITGCTKIVPITIPANNNNGGVVTINTNITTTNNITLQNNFTTYVNITNNITVNNNITNNFTQSVNFGLGISNSTFDSFTYDTESYFNNPFLAYGCYENWLLQTESFDTTWKRQEGVAVIANSALSPVGNVIAENIRGNTTNTTVYQEITNVTQTNMTFSVWMRTQDGLDNAVTVGLRLNSNNYTFSGQETNFTVTKNWARYNITTNINYTHTIKNVSILNGVNNVSVWGAQLERGLYASPYSIARTTTANYVKTCSLTSRLQIITASVAVTTITATTGTFTGLLTVNNITQGIGSWVKLGNMSGLNLSLPIFLCNATNGNEGRLLFNYTGHKPIYCNSTDWVQFG